MIIVLALLLVSAGAVLLVAGLTAGRQQADAATYLRGLDDDDVVADEFVLRLREPFLRRVVAPLGSGAFHGVASITPANYLDGVHKKLLLAGMTSSVKAEEFVTAQALSTAFGILAAVGWSIIGGPADRLGLLALVMLPVIGFIAPSAWLTRKVEERKDSIRRDLPDILDLMAISVEAGVGFEGAIEVVIRNFETPLAEELSRTLREMELGLPRREALQNLKRRTEVPELSNFVLALTQADALGMPVGRVLKTQAAEMRLKRRQWARETAAKMPVKILFPLTLFIFPAIMVVVCGPAAISIATNL
jgi:tight adherence protein C